MGPIKIYLTKEDLNRLVTDNIIKLGDDDGIVIELADIKHDIITASSDLLKFRDHWCSTRTVEECKKCPFYSSVISCPVQDFVTKASINYDI